MKYSQEFYYKVPREITWSSCWLIPHLYKKEMEKDDIPGLYHIYTNIS